MFELEHLYEQLKNETAEQSYIECFASVTESACDTFSVENTIQETMQAIEEASKSKGFGKINALKAKLTSVEKVLSKYKDTALKVNPIGLEYKGYKTFMTDAEIKKLHDEAIKYLNSFNPDKATEEQCKDYINDSMHNVQYFKISEIYGKGKRTFKIKDIIVTKQADKNISKADVSAAVKIIQSGNAMIKNAQEGQKKIEDEYGKYVKNGGLATMNTRQSIDKLRKNANNHKVTLISIADATYFQMLIQKYMQELEQAKRIVVKAANYNPRNIKESYKVQDYIDSAYAFLEATGEV